MSTWHFAPYEIKILHLCILMNCFVEPAYAIIKHLNALSTQALHQLTYNILETNVMLFFVVAIFTLYKCKLLKHNCYTNKFKLLK